MTDKNSLYSYAEYLSRENKRLQRQLEEHIASEREKERIIKELMDDKRNRSK